MKKIFVTGISGLIGGAARRALESLGYPVCGCDLRSPVDSERFDFRDVEKLRAVLGDCGGVLHLAAVSRVVWGETHPELCRRINIDGTRVLMDAVLEMPQKMWLIYASSREIYGTPSKLPCTADLPPNPENLYARTKLAGERMADDLRRAGVRTLVVRFSNVFGSVEDYHDRVVPAFAKAAAHGGTLSVRGADSVLDFTPLPDAVSALVCAVRAASEKINGFPAVDIVTGRATSLMELAKMARACGGGNIAVEKRENFYPARFQGDPAPAKKYLGWSPRKSLEESVEQLVRDFRRTTEEGNEGSQNHSWVSAAV